MREEFTEDVKRSAAARVGNRCSNPECRALTSGPQEDPTKALNVGVAAHITAASPPGPRYAARLTAEARRHPDNAIWLCQTCAKLVDNDPQRFTVEDLRSWKRQAEAVALTAVGKTFSSPAGLAGTAGLPPLSLSLRIEPNVGYAAPQGRIEHAFRVSLRNVSQDEVVEYRVEIEFPAGLVATPSSYAFHWVRERSGPEVDFFRFTQQVRRPQQIYPGDTVEVFSLQYSTQHLAPGARMARVSLYLKGYAALTEVLDVSPATLTGRA